LWWTGFDVTLIIHYTTLINRFKSKAEMMAISQRLGVCQEEIAHLIKTFANRELNGICTLCPTRYRTRHFFNNITTNEDIATKFEADLPHCVRNVTTS
jgi:hypothetical protein